MAATALNIERTSVSTFGEAVDGKRGPTLTVGRRSALFAKRVRMSQRKNCFIVFLLVCLLRNWIRT